MCLLTKKLAEIHNGLCDDAVIIQPKSTSLTPDYGKATGIIRRIFTDDENKSWSFHSLLNMEGVILSTAGVIGDIETAVNAAQYQHGVDMSNYDYHIVNYCDAGFPGSLVP